MLVTIGRLRLVSVAVALLAAGCTAPFDPVASTNRYIAFDRWSQDGFDGVNVKTDHYLIHSTIENRDTLETVARVMEGALRQYQQFAPGVRMSARPLECFIFARRGEWAEFTREHTGTDATIYLQINRGGYTVRDWYVAYFIGDVGTYAVAAHEGWHQYVARNFKSRLPPFLEEGIATMFETIDWSGSQPRWRLGSNRTRAEKLRRGIEQNDLWPLEKLVTMHAGDVVNLPGERIELFYAQNWAFAMFLWDADNQRYRPALQRMLCDLSVGTAPETLHIRTTGGELWDPASAEPLLEHYLAMNLREIDEKYQSYLRRLANDRRHEP